MPEGPSQMYLVRDPEGNVYGPADGAMLRDWVRQGRIVAGMAIAPRETREWVEATGHSELADLFRERALPAAEKISAADLVDAAPARPVPTLPASIEAAPLTRAAGTSAAIPAVGDQSAPISYYAQPARQHVLGILSFIFGLVGILSTIGFCIPLCGCIALPLGALLDLAAVTLGAIAIYQINADPTEYRGKGFAVAGLSMGGCVLLLCGLALIVGMVINVTSR